jgi:hypothetical protein
MEATQMPMTQKEANKLNAMKAAVKLQWNAACEVEGVPVDSKFVVFSNDNRAAYNHNKLMGEFLDLRSRIIKNMARRDRHATMKDLGLNRVRGAQGGVFYE